MTQDTPGLPPENSALTEAERLIMELERRAATLQNEDDQESSITLLTFFLGEEWYGFPLDQVKVVARVLEVTPVPGTSPYVLGVINYKSSIYPLIDLHQLLGIEPNMPTRASRIIIVNYDQNSFAVIVDSMTEVKEVRQSALLTQIRGSTEVSSFIQNEITLFDKLLGLLNLENVIKTVTTGETISL